MSAVRAISGVQSVAAISVRDESAVLQAVTSGSVRTPAGLKSFFGAMTVVAAPDTVSGFRGGGVTVTVTTIPTTATPTGGIPPYSHAWQQIGGSDWTIDNPTSATTTFSKSVIPGDTVETTFEDVVTDAAGFEATSNAVSATVSNFGGGGLL